MFPIGHFALGYLAVALVRRIRDRPLPDGWLLGAVFVGSQLPDLIDKPLTYYGVLESGRSFGHSLLVMGPVLIALLVVARRRGYGEASVALVVASLAHFVGDTYRIVLAGEWNALRFLLWPVFPPIDYPSDGIPPWIRVFNSLGDPRFLFQYALAVLAFGIWLSSRYRAGARSG
ncbi:metal-dependent hydrolase [Halobellus captivus]|uniref:metal-dependent hydrolase n=1 Tax=Halobellus captivus TaxID=2592614 RepID=UPI0011AADF26|nr:metal-dependent hydrolase [Halobellus captivus]